MASMLTAQFEPSENNSDITEEVLARALLARFTGAIDGELPPHMQDTPKRFVNLLREMTTPEPFNFTTFESDADDMVVLDPIPFYTLCAHHLAPFFGKAYIGYIPDGKIAGLSKFARAVKSVAKGFHVQEELNRELADWLEEVLEPRGVAVVMRAEHLCMAMRGVQVAGVKTTTSTMKGVFSEHDRTAKAEFFQIIQNGGGW
jgi:GTP cyclohydrolase I